MCGELFCTQVFRYKCFRNSWNLFAFCCVVSLEYLQFLVWNSVYFLLYIYIHQTMNNDNSIWDALIDQTRLAMLSKISQIKQTGARKRANIACKIVCRHTFERTNEWHDMCTHTVHYPAAWNAFHICHFIISHHRMNDRTNERANETFNEYLTRANATINSTNFRSLSKRPMFAVAVAVVVVAMWTTIYFFNTFQIMCVYFELFFLFSFCVSPFWVFECLFEQTIGAIPISLVYAYIMLFLA